MRAPTITSMLALLAVATSAIHCVGHASDGEAEVAVDKAVSRGSQSATAAQSSRGERSRWGPFTGRVVDASTGTPIHGAVVIVFWTKGSWHPGRLEEFYDARTAITDRDGRFEIARRRRPFAVAIRRGPFVLGIAPDYVPYEFAPKFEPKTAADRLPPEPLNVSLQPVQPAQGEQRLASSDLWLIPDGSFAEIASTVNRQRRGEGLRAFDLMHGKLQWGSAARPEGLAPPPAPSRTPPPDIRYLEQTAAGRAIVSINGERREVGRTDEISGYGRIAQITDKELVVRYRFTDDEKDWRQDNGQLVVDASEAHFSRSSLMVHLAGPRGVVPPVPTASVRLYQNRTFDEWLEDIRSPSVQARKQAVPALASFRPQSIPVLVEALDDPDPGVRLAVITALTRASSGTIVGPGSKEIDAEIARARDHSDPAVRAEAAAWLRRQTLRTLNPSDPQTVPALIQATQDAHPHVRGLALRRLGQVAPASKEAAAVAIDALDDADEMVRLQAAMSLLRMPTVPREAAPALLHALTDDYSAVRSYAADSLGKLGLGDNDTVAALEKALRDPGYGVRRSAARALGDLGAAAKPALPALLAALEDENVEVRASAAQAIGRIDPSNATARDQSLRAIVDGLGDAQSLGRAAALQALRGTGAGASDAVPALVAALHDSDPQVRVQAARALGEIGPAAANAVPALIAAAGTEDMLTRTVVIQALGMIGPAAKQAVPLLMQSKKEASVSSEALVRMGAAAAPALIEALADSDPYNSASEVLAKIGPAALPALERALRDERPLIRKKAASVLSVMGPKAAPAAPALAERVRDPDPAVRTQVLIALGAMGSSASTVVPALTKALPDTDDLTAATEIIRTLVRIGPAAVPALVDRLQASNARVRGVTAHALGELGSAAGDAVPALIATLDDSDRSVQDQAIASLAAIGPDARAAVPALRAILRSPADPRLPRATEALGRIGAAAVDAVPELITILSGPPDPQLSRDLEALGKNSPADKHTELFARQLTQADAIRLRLPAIVALGRMGPSALAALPSLLSELADASLEIPAAEAILRIAPENRSAAGRATKVLNHAIADSDDERRRLAFKAVGDLGPAAKGAVPAVARALADPRVQLDAAEALGRIGAPAVPAVMAALKDKRNEVREYAIRAVTKIGPPAKEAVPALARMVREPDPSMRNNVQAQALQKQALQALGSIGAEAVPTLRDILRSGNATQRGDAAIALRHAGAPAVPAVMELLDDANTRPSAVSILDGLGPDARAAVPALAKALDDDRLQVQGDAIRCLGNIGGAQAVSLLAELLTRNDGISRVEATKSLAKIGTPAAAALALALRNPDGATRAVASDALVQLGPDALPVLVPMLKEPTAGVRGQAEAVIIRLGCPVLSDLERIGIEQPDLRDEVTKLRAEIAPC